MATDNIKIRINRDTHRNLKIISAIENITMIDLLEEFAQSRIQALCETRCYRCDAIIAYNPEYRNGYPVTPLCEICKAYMAANEDAELPL